jgi:4-hydroxy-tetrahydrodipicolinate synthase
VFKPKGILPALVTPFSKDSEEVDEPQLRKLVNYCIEKGVEGVVPCGTTGEFVNMTLDEKKRTIEVVVDEVNGRVPVVAGAGASGTAQALHMVKFAKNVGADAALVVTPYYLKSTSRGIYEHYSTIASKADLPIILYNIPQCTGLPLPWQMVEDLAQLPNIVGLKDSSGQLNFILAVLEKVRDKINVMCGHDEVVLPALAAGASGAILASANFIPEIWVKIYREVEKNNLKQARVLQYGIQKIARITVQSGAVASKEALRLIGINVGKARLPLSLGGELTYEASEELRLELEKLGKVEPRPIDLETKEVPLEERFKGVHITPQTIQEFSLRVGEALAGKDSEVAHIDLMIGNKDGPVGAAYARAKANPTPGHEALVAILEPNIVVKPITLMIPTVTIRNMRQASMVYGPAQAGVAKAVADTMAENSMLKQTAEEIIIIANVFVHPSAVDRQRVYINNYKAMRHALLRALEGRPSTSEVIRNKDRSRHPFKYTP